MDNIYNLAESCRNLFSDPIGEGLYKRVLDSVNLYGMSEYLDRGVLVGFSGGADSVFLVLFLLEYKRRISIDFEIRLCHVNHMIRANEADRDERFCVDFAHEVGLPIDVVRCDVPRYASEMGIGTEEAARKMRYSAFDDLISSVSSLGCISVAHNATDNVETVLFNITRGSGTKGASGISPLRDNIVRPLIRISASEIRDFLKSHGIKFVFDSSNDSDDYTRNYIRHHVLDELRKVSGSLEESFARFTDIQREDSMYLDSLAEAELLKLKDKSEFSVDFLRGLAKPIYYRVICRLVSSISNKLVSRTQVVNSFDLINSKDNFDFSFSGGVVLECQRGVCVLRSCIESSDFGELPLRRGVNPLPGYNADVIITDCDDVSFRNVYKFSTEAIICDDIIVEDLFVRFKNDGDSYKYGGITHKLKKVFNDRNIPPRERSSIPVVCDSRGILWVPSMSARDSEASQGSVKIKIILGIREKAPEEQEIFTAKQRK